MNNEVDPFQKNYGRATAAALTVLAVSLMAGGIPTSAQDGGNGQIHIVKDCSREVPALQGPTFARS